MSFWGYALLMNSDFKENFAKLIHQLRVQANIERGDGDPDKEISYRDFWRLFDEKGIEISYNSFRTWQEKEAMPRLKNIEQFAEYMGIEPWQLIKQLYGVEGDEEMYSQKVCEYILGWEDEDKKMLIQMLVTDLLPKLSSDDKFELMQQLAKPSTEPQTLRHS